MKRPPSTPSASLDREPDAGDDRLGKPQRLRQDDDVVVGGEGDREVGVAHRMNPLPLRETEEEELSEADIMEELDMDDLEDEVDEHRDAGDSGRTAGPGA